VGRENYHLTLAFLGEQGPEGVEAARRTVAAMEGLPAPTLAFAGLGTFPERGAWRVLVMRLAEAGAEGLPGGGRLAELHTALNERLAAEEKAAGLPSLNKEWDADPRRRRPFKAHITLARNRGQTPSDRGGLTLKGRGGLPLEGRGGLTPLGELPRSLPHPGGGFTLGAVVLYKSELRPRGALYTELETAKLAPI
jgi:2'-5' RNA ligase